MRRLIQVISLVIILLGLLHLSFAFPLQLNTDSLWFEGTAMGIVFAGLLNLVAIHHGGTPFTHAIALLANIIACSPFGFALQVLKQPQVYFGVVIFLFATIAFVIVLVRNQK